MPAATAASCLAISSSLSASSSPDVSLLSEPCSSSELSRSESSRDSRESSWSSSSSSSSSSSISTSSNSSASSNSSSSSASPTSSNVPLRFTRLEGVRFASSSETSESSSSRFSSSSDSLAAVWKLSSSSSSDSDSSMGSSFTSGSAFFRFFFAASSFTETDASSASAALDARFAALRNKVCTWYRDSRFRSSTPSAAPSSMNRRDIRFIVAASRRTIVAAARASFLNFGSIPSSSSSSNSKSSLKSACCATPPSAPSAAASNTDPRTRRCNGLCWSNCNTAANALRNDSVAVEGTSDGLWVFGSKFVEGAAFRLLVPLSPWCPFFVEDLSRNTVRGAPPLASFGSSGSHPTSTLSFPAATLRSSPTNSSEMCRRRPTSTMPLVPATSAAFSNTDAMSCTTSARQSRFAQYLSAWLVTRRTNRRYLSMRCRSMPTHSRRAVM
mmetsp:Transcript_7259/g.30164  ORF Transcript_7259/g.30164 Transcript_7259/m.30164 type:complete len:442 (+) Transcript_7259:759-2084(+)